LRYFLTLALGGVHLMMLVEDLFVVQPVLSSLLLQLFELPYALQPMCASPPLPLAERPFFLPLPLVVRFFSLQLLDASVPL